MKKILIIIFYTIFIITNSFSQKTYEKEINTLIQKGNKYRNTSIDTSLFFYSKALEKSNKINDTSLIIKSLNLIGVVHSIKGDYQKALQYMNQSLELSKKQNNKKGIAKNLGNIALIYQNKSEYSKAIEYGLKSLEIYQKLNDKQGISKNLSNIGNIYWYQSNYNKALEYYLKSLKLNEEIRDSNGISFDLGNIGIIYYNQKNYNKALEYYLKALEISRLINNTYNSVKILGSIGIIYTKNKNYTKALSYHIKAYKIAHKIGYKLTEAMNLGNIGTIYQQINQKEKALIYMQKALDIYKSIDNKYGEVATLINISNLYNNTKQYTKAIKILIQALESAKKINSLELQLKAYKELSQSYTNLKNYEKALNYQNLWINIKDSIFNIEKTKAITELRTKYETEKKEQKIAEQKLRLAKEQSENKAKDLKLKHSKIIMTIIVIILLFVIIIAFMLLKLFNQKRKANMLLTKQKREIVSQRNEIKLQNKQLATIHKELEQSITYAKRIQAAVMPDNKILSKIFKEYFIFSIPKNVMSGDFFWILNNQNNTIITVADCTGHGVPGAFMSMLGVSFLREIIERNKITEPNEILDKLRNKIIVELKQKGIPGEQQDGMDMAVITINHKSKKMQYSGANNPIYIIKNKPLKHTNDKIILFDNTNHKTKNSKLLYEIKPDKMPIGIYIKMENFSKIEIELQENDQIYLFTDGFADQFGGENNKKFKYKPFKQLLLQNAEKPMHEQKQIIEKTFINWKNENEQIDDVTIVGIKI